MLSDELQRDVKIIQEFHHPFFDLYKRSDGIIVRVSKDHAHYTISETHEYVTALRNIMNGTPHKVLLIPGKNSTMDSASRAYLASDEALKGVKALAGVFKTVSHRLIGSLYLEFNKPKIPAKFFETSEEAITWLKSQNG